MNKKTKTVVKLRAWRVLPRSRYIVVSEDGKRNICKVYNARGGKLESEARGNALLIANAPRAYNALLHLLSALKPTLRGSIGSLALENEEWRALRLAWIYALKIVSETKTDPLGQKEQIK
jgi:hypothetical protein